MAEHIFTGFGFGPIQSGLFACQAAAGGNFARIVIAEIDQVLVDAVRRNNGSFFVNVAGDSGIEVVRTDNVEMLNPTDADDRRALSEVLSQSTEIVTSLPSVAIYSAGGDNSVAAMIGQALHRSTAPAVLIYTAENNNHAAEILSEQVAKQQPGSARCPVQYLNTVIGKMSQVVTNPDRIAEMKLTPIVPGLDRAFLVEQFNRILVTRCVLDGFRPGIEVFIEKDDLLPFEEAKLYGHNAIHAMLSYLGAFTGRTRMTEIKDDHAVMQIARSAFLDESGAALIDKYADMGDELFTESGYRAYAEDLLERMTNPYLQDTIARSGRDVVRKLGYSDRIFGTMALALEHGIEPVNMAVGALAGVAALAEPLWNEQLPDNITPAAWPDLDDTQVRKLLESLWQGQSDRYTDRLMELTCRARSRLAKLTTGH